MRAIRRKLDARVPGGAAASSNGNSAPNTPKKTPRSAAGKKRNAAEMAVGGFLEDDEEDVKPSVDSPSRKKGKGKATTQAKPAARSAVVGDDDDGAVRVKSERTEEEHDVIEDDGAEEGEFRCGSHLILACLLTCSFFAQSQTSRKSESGQSHPSLWNGSSWNMNWIRIWSGYSEIYLVRCCTDVDDSRSCSIGLSN